MTRNSKQTRGTFLSQVNVSDAYNLNLRFNGSLVNPTMAKAMQAFKATASVKAKDLLGQLDREFGHSVLTGSYSKLRMLLYATKGKSSMFEWVLESMLTGLRRQEISPEELSMKSFEKGRPGAPSFVELCGAQQLIVEHLVSVVDALGHSVDQKLSEELRIKVLTKLATPVLYSENFPVPRAPQVESDGMDVSDRPSLAAVDTDLLATLAASSCRGVVCFAEMFKKVYDGTYDKDVCQLAGHANPIQALQQQDAAVLGSFGKDLADVLRSLHTAGSVVSTDSDNLPKASLRELVRRASDGGDDDGAAVAERNEIWRKAVAHRKKLVALALVASPRTEKAFQDAEKKCSAVLAAANSKLSGDKSSGDTAVYIFSGDLHVNDHSGKTPWLVAGEPDEKIVKESMKYIVGQKGQAVAMLAFDGCQRKVRRLLDAEFASVANFAEVFIVYKKAWNAWIKKKHFFTSETTECAFVRTTLARNKVAVKTRSTYNGAGESSTHYTSYTGVDLPPRMSLPRISGEDKLKIFSEAPDALPARWCDSVSAGVPLFWGETKSQNLWKQLLMDVDAKSVVDTTPSTALAMACMDLGIAYKGLVGNQTQMQWLTNTIDRASLKFICTAGSFLYQEELAKHIKDLFSDVVDACQDETNDEAIEHSDVEAA